MSEDPICGRVLRTLVPEVDAVLYMKWNDEFTAACESPIEKAFFVSLRIIASLVNYDLFVRDPDVPLHQWSMFVKPQVEIGEFRADFLLGYFINGQPAPLDKCLVVECDGHDWHERTKEQAARDKSRDRYLQTRVAKVIRFTGSEIYAHPVKCAGEALKMLTQLMGIEQ